jgi:hypothetical protein
MTIKRLTPEDRATAWSMYYDRHLSSEAVAAHLGVSGPAIRATLRRMGGQIRSAPDAHRTLPLREDAFAQITPEAAYWAGMLVTDGCIYDEANPQSSPRLELTLHAEDVDHVRAFGRFMGGDGESRIGFAEREGRRYARWDARSVRLAADLAALGVVPRKTRIAAPPAALRDDPDFWRGCWDGDGEVDDGNNCPDVNLVGSFPLIEAFCDFFAQRCPEYPLKPRPSGNTDCTACVKLYGHGAQVLLRTLYDRPGPAMARKSGLAKALLTKYDGRSFRILKVDISQRASFPWAYTDLRRAHADFAALQELDARALVRPLTKSESRAVVAHSVEASRVGMYASHLFHERVRMTANVRGKPSPAAVWDDPAERERIIAEAESRKHSSLRASLTANTRPCWGFRPAAAKAVYQHFAPSGPVRILDPCAGWGDRLTAALALPQLGCYHGVDPNRAMQPVYERIRNCYSGHAPAAVAASSFEDASLPDEPFDIVFTSPPYFDYEEYSTDPEQSYRRYPTREAWAEGFLHTLVRRSAASLKHGGVLALNLSDAGSDGLVDDMAKAAEGDGRLRFAGVMLLQTGNFDRACEGIYCWRRV